MEFYWASPFIRNLQKKKQFIEQLQYWFSECLRCELRISRESIIFYLRSVRDYRASWWTRSKERQLLRRTERYLARPDTGAGKILLTACIIITL